MQAGGKVNFMVSSKDSDKGPCKGFHQCCIWMAVLIVLASLVMTGAVSAATPITGPTTITVPGDYYLANNIIDSAVGIIIAVPNVVLDGKGKTLDGVDGASSVGIRIYNAGMTLFNVVVKNVVVTDWGNGVFLTDVKSSQLEKVTASSNTGNGILLQNSLRNTIKTCTATGNGVVGILLYEGSNSNTITGNTATANGDDGVRIRFSSNNDILNNKLLNNKGSGLNFNEQGNFNTVTGNTMTGNKNDGIEIYRSSDNIFTKNTVKDNIWHGIRVYEDSYDNEFTQNTVMNNTYNGIILMDDANYNMVFSNTFDKNNDSGIRIIRNSRNTIYGNYVRNNVDDGIMMWDTANNVIVNNYFYNAKNANLVSGLPANKWNLTQSAKKSITGGANSGGNSWGQPNGQGFSQITPATNGICNQPYTLATNNIDRLPLKYAKK
jgi:parallel beta-helix repeat protein